MKKGQLTRRTFLQGAAAVGLAATVGCTVPSRNGVKVYKRSSRGLRVSNAIRKHNANHLYANLLAALGDPAHPGDHSKVVTITISKAQFDKLFPQGKTVADLRHDL